MEGLVRLLGYHFELLLLVRQLERSAGCSVTRLTSINTQNFIRKRKKTFLFDISLRGFYLSQLRLISDVPSPPPPPLRTALSTHHSRILPCVLVHLVELCSNIVERDLFVAKALSLQLLSKGVQVQLVQLVGLPAKKQRKKE